MKKKGAFRSTIALLLSLGMISGPGASFAAPANCGPEKTSTDCADSEVSFSGYYTVKKGDTLARIAAKYLGSSERWKEITTANPGIKPNRLEIGSRLRMPVDSKLDDLDTPGPKSVFSTAGIAKKADSDPVAKPVEKVDLSFLDSAGSKSVFDSILPEDDEDPIKEIAGADPETAADELPTPKFVNTDLKLPEDIKTGKISQYFANAKGFHGLFNTESAWYPEERALIVGIQPRYDNYKKFNFNGFEMSGSQWVMPMSVLFLRHKLMAGLTIPAQSWEVSRTGLANNVSFNGMHDPALRVGYQIWRDYAGFQAVSLHFEGRFASGNYHQPMLNMTDKTRTGVQIGPAEATRGAWFQIGGAYSRQLTSRWNSHLNLTLANDPRDGISKINPRASLEYLLDPNCVAMAEVDAPSWTMEKGPDGSNVDMLLGLAWFNENWQFSVGVPFAVQSEWGYKRDYGLMLGLNYRQD